MDVREALKLRKSTRAFLDKEVSIETINKVLENAKHAPSGVNTQPWQVAVLTGKSKNTLCDKIESTFRAGTKSNMDYQYYPLKWEDKYKDRRKECGLLMYSTLNISRDDKQKQIDQWAQNYQSFGAPMLLIFLIDKILEKGSFLDYGMFIQSTMLSAVEEGLGVCPQASIAEYPDIIREELGYSEEKLVLCGLAVGYEDKNNIINSYRTPRENIDTFVKYFS